MSSAAFLAGAFLAAVFAVAAALRVEVAATARLVRGVEHHRDALGAQVHHQCLEVTGFDLGGLTGAAYLLGRDGAGDSALLQEPDDLGVGQDRSRERLA